MNKDYRIKIKTTHYGAFLILKKKARLNLALIFVIHLLITKNTIVRTKGC